MELGNVLPHPITIEGSSNKGFIVKTGCCICVFTNKEVMLDAIEEYINDTEKMEKAYKASNKNNHIIACDSRRTSEEASEPTTDMYPPHNSGRVIQAPMELEPGR